MLIEVHHLLPLGSLLKVQSTTTSIKDVVGICPTCHKATHQFYKVWLTSRGLDDFRNESEAVQVFQDAKNSVVLAA
jgi:predicted HNH restriction endonuclease